MNKHIKALSLIILLFTAVILTVTEANACDQCRKNPGVALNTYLSSYAPKMLGAVIVYQFAPEFFESHPGLTVREIYACSKEEWKFAPELHRTAMLIVAQNGTTVTSYSLSIDDNGKLAAKKSNALKCSKYTVCLVRYLEGETAPKGKVIITHSSGLHKSEWEAPTTNNLPPDIPMYYATARQGN